MQLASRKVRRSEWGEEKEMTGTPEGVNFNDEDDSRGSTKLLLLSENWSARGYRQRGPDGKDAAVIIGVYAWTQKQQFQLKKNIKPQAIYQ